MWNRHIHTGTQNVHNVHNAHRDPETRKTLKTSLFRYEIFLLPLSLKVFRHKEGDAQSLYADFSICPKPRATPTARPWWASESQPPSSDAKTPLTHFSQISVHTSDAWHHSHPTVTFSIWGFILTSVNDVSSPAFMLHLTNPCAK